MTVEIDGRERRQFGRRRSCIHAFVLVPGRAPTPCLVRNYSASGAMLELAELVEPPFNFAIRIGLDGLEIRCEVRHQHGLRIGARFLGEGVGDVLALALGGLVRPRKGRRRTLARGSEVDGPLPRVTGRELRRTVLGQT